MLKRFTFARTAPALRPLYAVGGMGPARIGVQIVGGHSRVVRVRMGWAFHADIPVATIVAAERDDRKVGAWGVHGWNGRWLVNTTGTGIVRLQIDPPVNARVLGLRLRIHDLRLSLDTPDTFLYALAAAR